MKKIRLFLLLILYGLSLSFVSCNGYLKKEVVILHTNDTHGYLEGDDESIIGIDQLSALHSSIENSILVDAGDATQGLPLASLTKGNDIIDLMNTAHYDVMGVGNHEFDFGTDNLLANVEDADFPILAANVMQDGEALLSGVGQSGNGENTIIEVDGIKFGFFSIVTKDTQDSVNPELLGDVVFLDEIETAKIQVDYLKSQNVDFIIAITHLGDETGGASITSADLANAMTGEYQDTIDVIIDAHSHTIIQDIVNRTLIVQASSYMQGVGMLTFTIDHDFIGIGFGILDIEDFSNIGSDEATKEKLDEITSSQDQILDEVIGKVDTTLWGGSIGSIAIGRLVETNLGDLIADAFAYSASNYMKNNNIDIPLVGVENAGGIRGSLPYGDVTMRDLVTVLPYSNTLYLKKITPQILYEMMEISSSYIDGQDSDTGMLLQTNNFGGFLQISGFEVTYDASKSSSEEHVISIKLEGEDEILDKNDNETEIMLVSNNYIMSGGSSYTTLGELDKVVELGGELEVVLDYLEACIDDGSISNYSRPQGRIIMDGEYTPSNYLAKIQIESDSSLEGTSLTFVIDGTDTQTATVDSNGFVELAVSDGSHSIRLENGTKEVYVDNYIGIGLIVDTYRSWPTLVI